MAITLMSMQRRLTILAVPALASLVVAVGALLFYRSVSRSLQPTLVNSAYYQLKVICASVDQVLYDHHEDSMTLRRALREVSRVEGEEIMYLNCGRGVGVVLNDDIEMWRAVEVPAEDICAYFPYWFTDKDTGEQFCVGIGFDLRRRYLREIPAWERSLSLE